MPTIDTSENFDEETGLLGLLSPRRFIDNLLDSPRRLRNRLVEFSNNWHSDHFIVSLGYDQRLHRELDLLSSFSFGFNEVSVLASITSVYSSYLGIGGPAGSILTWVFTFIFSMITCASLAEICSAYPTAGSVYNWTGMMASDKYKPILSYICGIANFLGNGMSDAYFAHHTVEILAAIVFIRNGSTLTNEIKFLFSLIFLTIWTSISCLRVNQIGGANNYISAITLLLTIIILISLPSIAPSLNTTTYVFTHFNNTTGFENPAYVAMLSMVVSIFSFTGYEASGHMVSNLCLFIHRNFLFLYL